MYGVLAFYPLLFAWLWLTGRRLWALLGAVGVTVLGTSIDRALSPTAMPFIEDLMLSAIPVVVVTILSVAAFSLARRFGWLKQEEVTRLFGKRDR